MLRIFFGTKFKWEFSFDNSCIYDIGSDETDANKLCGLTYHFNPHIDSVRFGWEWNPSKNKIDIDAYCYVDGSRSNTIIASVTPNEKISGTIEINPTNYTLTLESSSIGSVSKTINKTKNNKVKFLLNPYFGGNRKAPHTIKIYLKRL